MKFTLLETAAFIVDDYYKGQLDYLGREPKVNHYFRVSSLLSDYTGDIEIIVAGLLYDVNHDSSYIEYNLNKRIADLVWESVELENNKSNLSYKKHLLNKFNKSSNDILTVKLVAHLDFLSSLIYSKLEQNTIRKYILATDYALDNISREFLPEHKKLLINLKFVNNYLALNLI